MTSRNETADHTIDTLRHALAGLVRDAPPAISNFARWALEHPEDIAFFSVRALAERAGVNVNTVYRLALALGFPGFEACRRAFQLALVTSNASYGERAAKLVHGQNEDLIDRIRSSASRNLESILSDENAVLIRKTATLLAQARRIHCIGVRSSFSLAHYLSYTGRMAFPSFARPVVEAGSILDVLSEASADDVAVLITFSLYSRELLRAHEVARDRNLKIVAITDGYTSPIAQNAEVVFCLPMDGPQTLPSLTAGFALVEAIVNAMILTDTDAPLRIADFEGRLLAHGAYLRTKPT